MKDKNKFWEDMADRAIQNAKEALSNDKLGVTNEAIVERLQRDPELICVGKDCEMTRSSVPHTVTNRFKSK
jgi:hypothetical protein